MDSFLLVDEYDREGMHQKDMRGNKPMANNRWKRQYISDLLIFQSVPFVSEMERVKTFLERVPTSLFKFRRFDRFSLEMINAHYAYLAPVEGLDDPFECVNRSGVDDFESLTPTQQKKKLLDFVLKKVYKVGNSRPPFETSIRQAFENVIDENGINEAKVRENAFFKEQTTSSQLNLLLSLYKSMNDNLEPLMENAKMKGFAERALYPAGQVGILSLTDKRDNKPMWSLYGDSYQGYCIEYEIRNNDSIVKNLCPVIYTKKANNDLFDKFCTYLISAFTRALTGGHISHEIGAAMELFCTKDKDWSYQSEWRVVAKSKGRLEGLHIKAIYLGFNVKPGNEQKMLAAAKRNGFVLYKMNPPNRSKRITYKLIYEPLTGKN